MDGAETPQPALTYAERVEAHRQSVAKQSRERRKTNARNQRCINEGKGIRGRGPHGDLKPKLDASGAVVGYYKRCAPCQDTHDGKGPNAGRNKRTQYTRRSAHRVEMSP